MNHAILAPSSASTRLQCPGSRKMQEMYPSQVTESTLQGQLAHEVLESTLRGTSLPEGATDEMLDGAEMFLETVNAHGCNLSNSHIEEQIDCTVINKDCWGTPDFWHWDEDLKILEVMDYKFGHSYVSEVENWQLIEYAIGIITSHNIAHFGDATCLITIVQPRCYGNVPVRTWGVSFDELLDTYLPLAIQFEAEAMNPNAKCKTGAECKHCPARHACQTLQHAGYAVIHLASEMSPYQLDPKAISNEYRLLLDSIELLKARASGLEDDITVRIRQGGSIPNFHLEQGYGRQKWITPISEVIALGEMMGVDVSKPDVITPKQAIKAGLPAEIVDSYSETPKGSFKLVSDKSLKGVFK